MSNSKGVGSPKGGRVHWFLLEFPKMLKQYYTVQYNYDKHNYFLIRKGLQNNDVFTIIRTSDRCWRVTYFDMETGFAEYQSYKKLYDVYDYVYFLNTKKLKLELERSIRNEINIENKIKAKLKKK